MYKMQLIATIFLAMLLFFQSSLALPVKKDVGSITHNQQSHSRQDRSIRDPKEKEKETCRLCWKVGKHFFCKELKQTNLECRIAKQTSLY